MKQNSKKKNVILYRREILSMNDAILHFFLKCQLLYCYDNRRIYNKKITFTA